MDEREKLVCALAATLSGSETAEIREVVIALYVKLLENCKNEIKVLEENC